MQRVNLQPLTRALAPKWAFSPPPQAKKPWPPSGYCPTPAVQSVKVVSWTVLHGANSPQFLAATHPGAFLSPTTRYMSTPPPKDM